MGRFQWELVSLHYIVIAPRFFFSQIVIFSICGGGKHLNRMLLSLNVCLCVQDHLMGSSAAEIIHDEALLRDLIRDESCPLAVCQT